MTQKTELIVALDVPDARQAAAVVDRLPPEVDFFKIGLELFAAEGPAVIETLRSRGRRVFLDLKFHDIPRTVARAVAVCARRGVTLLTVHAAGGRAMLQAAAAAAREAGADRPRLVAVTTLTSLDASDLRETGVARPLDDHTLALGELAVASGLDGLVCSPLEAAAFRARLGSAPLLVTPGIRPAGGEVGDQKRVATVAEAVRAGATYLVVGRPILEAADPAAAARRVLAEIAEASAA